jgi:uncharacterized protein YciI
VSKKVFVVILDYIVPIEKIDQARPNHLKFLDYYYDKGLLLCSGRQNPVKGGVIIAKCESKKELENIMNLDPFMIQKLAIYKIYEFTPTKYIPELEDVFVK